MYTSAVSTLFNPVANNTDILPSELHVLQTPCFHTLLYTRPGRSLFVPLMSSILVCDLKDKHVSEIILGDGLCSHLSRFNVVDDKCIYNGDIDKVMKGCLPVTCRLP